MQNAWNANKLNGDVITARVSQCLGIMMLQASFEPTPGIFSIDRMSVDRCCRKFEISQRKYYDVLQADVHTDGRLNKGLIKLRDVHNLASRLNIKTSTLTKAAEESQSISECVRSVCDATGIPVPPFLDSFESSLQAPSLVA